MTTRKHLPKTLEKRLFQEAGSKCPICGEKSIEALAIHHIVPFTNNEEHNSNDLIVLCGSCHAKADAGTISRTDLYEIKRKLLLAGTASSNVVSIQAFRNKGRAGEESPRTNIAIKGTGNVNLSGNPVVHGNITVTNVKTTKKSKSAPIIIPGTIGEDPRKYGYMNYLIRRYNEFKKWECDRNGEKLKYAIIRVSYSKEFKYDVKDTPLDLFGKAVAYLQERIRKTKLGKINNSRGQRLFCEFEDFDEKTAADEE